MPNLKDIKDRINSINSTQKITQAMKMVAAAKVKKSENAVKRGRPFTSELMKMFARLLDAVSDYSEDVLKVEKGIDNYPVLLKKREKKTAGLLVVTSSKGLAGAYNANIVRHTLKLVEENAEKGIATKLFVAGQKGLIALKRQAAIKGFEILKSYTKLPSEPNATTSLVIAEDMAQAFVDGKIDSIEIVTTRFRNMMSYSVEEWKVLPVELEEEAGEDHKIDPLMMFDTSEHDILQKLVPLYISNTIYQSLLEAVASELASRMTAMSAATSNAQEMIRLLTIDYNKARQAAITQEISEVVSGADALKN